MESKYFPITQGVACQSKWAWSTVFLTEGTTRSCHRASESPLTAENFHNFHNTETKLSDRQKMLNGVWPTGGCTYCSKNEEAGGFSDRMLHNKIPNLTPIELETDITATTVTPTILEVFFDNTCNLSCLYCIPELSSKIAEENRKFGAFNTSGVNLPILEQKHLQTLAPELWKWMDNNFQSLKRFHFLGGEPFLQKELDKLLNFIDTHPNSDCELNLVTNLMVSHDRLEKYIKTCKHLIDTQKIRRLDITASIDCWGHEQEYVRHGIDLVTWTENFVYLLNNQWITLNINQTITPLTIKTMPILLKLLSDWKKVRPIGHFFSVAEPGPSYLRPNIFGPGVFNNDFKQILSLMDNTNDQEQTAISYMTSIANDIEIKEKNSVELKKLLVFLNEKDRRRGTNWQKTFPWLEKHLNNVV